MNHSDPVFLHMLMGISGSKGQEHGTTEENTGCECGNVFQNTEQANRSEHKFEFRQEKDGGNIAVYRAKIHGEKLFE